jgi:tRNA (cytidine32/uridine32-2'-O)-methyltransferase
MKNMGISKLYLVRPKSFPDDQAVWRAASAGDILDNAVVVDTLEEAVADCGLVVGTSARGRRIPWPLVNPRDCAERVCPQLDNNQLAFVFGREDRGLTNEELQRCNLHVHIPTNEEYSSLNLAMAVQVICYEMRMTVLANTFSHDEMADWDAELATAADLERYFAHLEETLIDMEFLNPAAPKQLMSRLRRLYSRKRMDDLEVSMLRGILSASQAWVARARKAEE